MISGEITGASEKPDEGPPQQKSLERKKGLEILVMVRGKFFSFVFSILLMILLRCTGSAHQGVGLTKSS